MNLVFDLGNTRAKVAVFDGDHMVDHKILPELTEHEVETFSHQHLINKAIVSSVVHTPAWLLSFLNKRYELLTFDHATPLPLKNLYKTPQTLGLDRLANAVAAHNLYPGKNVVVVDIGTAIKFDFVNSAGEYLGGSIGPGPELRFRSLNTFTDHLPLIEGAANTPLIGNSTESSIRSGVLNGMRHEVQGMLEEYSNIYADLHVLYTGGGAKILGLDKVSGKNGTFALAFLTLMGLNVILAHNAS